MEPWQGAVASFPDGGSVVMDRSGIHPSWLEILASEFDQPYMQKLVTFLEQEAEQGKTILPPAGMRFNALRATPPNAVKVVILGQDPYPTQGHAHGLSFSVLPEVKPLPRSLRNIYNELQADMGIDSQPTGYLQAWAEQGVLLLNTVLSVAEGNAGSHQGKGWEPFTDRIICTVSDQLKPVVFMLWGSHAQKKAALVDASRHLLIQTAHPSPLSARRGFFGSKPFSMANAFLEKHGREGVVWQL